MEFANVIAQRHSTRHYLESEPLSRQAVLELIGQAQQAPSWKNCQSTRYYVLTKPEAKADFAARCLPPFNAKNVEHAVALFVVTFAKEKSGYRLRAGEPNVPANELADMWGAYDAGLSSDHLCWRRKTAATIRLSSAFAMRMPSGRNWRFQRKRSFFRSLRLERAKPNFRNRLAFRWKSKWYFAIKRTTSGEELRCGGSRGGGEAGTRERGRERYSAAESRR